MRYKTNDKHTVDSVGSIDFIAFQNTPYKYFSLRLGESRLYLLLKGYR